MNWDSKRRAYSCFPIQLDGVLVFTVAVQPNLRAVKCQHALIMRGAIKSTSILVGRASCPTRSPSGAVYIEEQHGQYPCISEALCVLTRTPPP